MDVDNGQSADDHQSERRRYEAAATALEGREVIYREGIYALIKITGIQVSDWGFEANATFFAQLPVGSDPGFRVFPDGWSFSCAWSVFSGRFETAFSGLYAGWRIYPAAEMVEKARALLNQPNVSKEEGWAFRETLLPSVKSLKVCRETLSATLDTLEASCETVATLSRVEKSLSRFA